MEPWPFTNRRDSGDAAGPRGFRFGLSLVCVAVLAALALPSAALADVTAVEGQSFSGTVVDVGCDVSSAEIYWGDGTPTSTGESDGGTGVQGTHTYDDERTTTGTVTYTCFNQDQTRDFAVTVQDAPLTSAAHDISGTSGQSLTPVVGHFDDPNPAATVDEFSAQIDWGDGTTAAGSITSAAGGGFDIAGTHTYAAPGSYTVTTTVDDVGGSTTSATSTARIVGPLAGGFTVNPGLPCRDEKVTFDASSSSGGTVPITQYHWIFNGASPLDGLGYPVENIVTTNPVYTQSFGPTTTVGPTNLVSFGFFAGYDEDFTLFRPPVSATLIVTDARGRTALVSRDVAFADPKETVTFEVDFSLVKRGWVSSPVAGSDAGCDKRVKTQPSGGYGPAKVPKVASVRSSTVTARLACGALENCAGVLEIHSIGSSQLRRASSTKSHRPSDPTLLGDTGFLIYKGQTGTVKIKLSAHGKALKRAGKLHKVILTVTTFGPKGTTRTTSRTVVLRTSR